MKSDISKKIWLTPLDLEGFLDIKIDTQNQYRTNKKIPYHKVGGFVLYNIFEIHIWIESHSVVSLETSCKNMNNELQTSYKDKLFRLQAAYFSKDFDELKSLFESIDLI